MNKKILDVIVDLLKENYIPSEKQFVDSGLTDEVVVINIGPDPKERARSLVLIVQEVDFGKDKEKDKGAELRGYQPSFHIKKQESFVISISSILPFSLEEGAIGETARALLFFNNAFEFPGFGMDERNKLMYYRCVFTNLSLDVLKEELVTYVGMAMLTIDSFSETIEAVASGEKSMSDAINERMDALKQDVAE